VIAEGIVEQLGAKLSLAEEGGESRNGVVTLPSNQALQQRLYLRYAHS
jgi:hypothetical protein